MQTRFAPERLADPTIAEADGILRKCVHCGFCNATCPTYALLGDERDGPRGRIYLIKDMLEGDRPADPTTVKHIDRCLSCLACATTCPSGVDYGRLVDQARIRIEQTYRRPWADRIVRWLLPRVMSRPRLFARALRLGALARPAAPMLPRRLRAMLAALPPRVVGTRPEPMTAPAQIERRMRVALVPGCVQPVLAPEIDEAAIRLLTRRGAEVVVAPDSGCCGALAYHLGQVDEARRCAGANVAAWDHATFDAVAVTASGCGSVVKDYGHVFRGTAQEQAAARVGARTRDVTELVAELGLGPAGKAPRLKVAYHSACSLQHAQKLDRLPRDLLAEAGFDLVEIPEGYMCCGSADTYSLLQPELSDRLRTRKAENIMSTSPDVVAAGNLGCITQIGRALGIPVVHTVELLDWATGGPPPEALTGITPEGAAAGADSSPDL
jgi:glycolate oxidase iron-sulfur subunit